MPEAVERPAPVRTTTRRAWRQRAASSSRPVIRSRGHAIAAGAISWPRFRLAPAVLDVPVEGSAKELREDGGVVCLERMSVTHLTVRVRNPRDPRRYSDVEMLVDSGALYAVLPAPLLRRLGIRPDGKERFTLADGSHVVRENRHCHLRDRRAAARVPRDLRPPRRRQPDGRPHPGGARLDARPAQAPPASAPLVASLDQRGAPAPRPVGRSPPGPHSPLAALGPARSARGDSIFATSRTPARRR